MRPAGGQSVPADVEDIVRTVKANHPKSEAKDIVRAFELALSVHEGQRRASGEAFIQHPIGVARILADLGMDATTIIAAFLHDTVEDTHLELAELRAEFGEQLADIIDGLTKIDKIHFSSAQQEQAENLRKMIVAMAKDLRVLVIKLADRLHNMRTIAPLSAQRREVVANETLEIYAPLAHRLGMEEIKAELEDLCFKTLHPKVYTEIEQMVFLRQPERQQYLSSVIDQVSDRLRQVRIKGTIKGRPKHYYSIYEKMVGRGREFDEIFDLVGVRILVDDLKDCYAAVGAIHSLWKPIPGRFKDYIAMPKFNLYQSLHTTVVGPEGKPLELQIRTREMDERAQWGVASHWLYKEGTGAKRVEEQAAWMRRMIEMQDTEDDAEFLASLRLDLFSDEVFVFTPKGKVVELPKGATPIDFAYSIHTEVGHACVGARAGGRLVPLSYQMTSGETIEVITAKASAGPSRDWLEMVVTARARNKIKQWFNSQRREEAVAEGKDSVQKAFRRAGLPVQKMLGDGSLEAFAVTLKYANLEALFVAVGEGRISAGTVVQRFVKEHSIKIDEEIEAPAKRIRTTPPATSGVIVQGTGEVWIKLARCCMPVPPDPIIGFITRGRGVSIHRIDCPNGKDLSTRGERLIEATWDPKATGSFAVSIGVECLDRPKLLRDITTAISDFGININSATSTVGGGIARLQFTFETTNPGQLNGILNTVKRVESVYDAYRLSPSGK